MIQALIMVLKMRFWPWWHSRWCDGRVEISVPKGCYVRRTGDSVVRMYCEECDKGITLTKLKIDEEECKKCGYKCKDCNLSCMWCVVEERECEIKEEECNVSKT